MRTGWRPVKAVARLVPASPHLYLDRASPAPRPATAFPPSRQPREPRQRSPAPPRDSLSVALYPIERVERHTHWFPLPFTAARLGPVWGEMYRFGWLG